MDERRKWYRIDCDFPCGYEHAQGASMSADSTSSVTRDLSEGGARLLVFEFLPVGRKIRVNLEIPHAEPVEAQMEILWVNEIPHAEGRFQVGGRFTTLAEDQRSEIRQYICERSLLQDA